MAIDRRLFLNIDWPLLGATLALAAIGLLLIASATRARRDAPTARTATPQAVSATTAPDAPPPARRTAHWIRQAGWIAIGLIAFTLTLSVDYRRLADRAPLLYLLAVLVLAGLLIFGPHIAGTRRWIRIGTFNLQPSELVKLVAALVVARIIGESRKETLEAADLLVPGAAIGLLVTLIAVQPDLGTAFCLVPLLVTAAFLGGLRVRTLITLALSMLLALGLAWKYAPLKDYQKRRIESFLNPGMDPRGAGWQSQQSRIAVGSGGFFGRGYGRGGQNQLGYLPARHTDFVFSVLAEETGFFGVSVVLGLYLTLFWRALETAHRARDRLGALLAAGITSMLAFQVIYNVAMVAGLVPVKGLPLPLLSYGGSSTLFSFMAIGLILNVRMRRFAN